MDVTNVPPPGKRRWRPPPANARSWLLVPASKPELFAEAAASEADAVVLDLEDAVVPAAKPAAREAVARWVEAGNRTWVRINDVTSAYWDEDVRLLASLPGIDGVVLAKTENPAQVEATAAQLAAGTKIIALLESARGIETAIEIADAASTFRLAFGSGDYRRDTGVADLAIAMAYPRSRLTIASRIAGLPGPIDGPSLDRAQDALAEAAQSTVHMGMTGKLCMHVDQVAVVNQNLAPSRNEIIWAQEVLERLGPDGSGVEDGSDMPRLARARKIVDLSQTFSP
ncbi:HpcH/HpaI aldolase/citrate lyase family protein [Nocardia sp. NPDC051750]|uniref:HpcH/HpaI aldolase/citrate lyase family protein n=1 Tax=Nocardia sp. NPDC051750 TaxID=3364325 RepID=UPI0037943397